MNSFKQKLAKCNAKNEHFKMYKVGRNWLFASVSVVALSQFLLGTTAKADTTSDQATTETAQTATADASQTSQAYSLKTSSSTDNTEKLAVTTPESTEPASDTTSESAATAAQGASADVASKTATASTVNETQQADSTSAEAETQEVTTENVQPASAKTAKVETTDATSSLPAGTNVTKRADGTTVYALPAESDINAAKAAITASGVTEPVEVNVAADAAGGTQLSGKNDAQNTVTTDGYGQINASDKATASQSFTAGGVASADDEGNVILLPVSTKNSVAQYIFNNNLDMTKTWTLSGLFNFADTWNKGQDGWSFANGAGIIISGATPAELAAGLGDASLGIGGIPDTIIAALDMYNNPNATSGTYTDPETGKSVTYTVTADNKLAAGANTNGNPGTIDASGVLVDPGQSTISAGGLAKNSTTAESTLKFMQTKCRRYSGNK